jgi:hypothetical protein
MEIWNFIIFFYEVISKECIMNADGIYVRENNKISIFYNNDSGCIEK